MENKNKYMSYSLAFMKNTMYIFSHSVIAVAIRFSNKWEVIVKVVQS